MHDSLDRDVCNETCLTSVVCGCFYCLQGVQQKRPSAAQNAILRRYFLELTQSFIIPLVMLNSTLFNGF